MDRMRIAIFGRGFVGRAAARALNPAHEVIHFPAPRLRSADATPISATEAVDQFLDTQRYRDLTVALSGTDCVLNCAGLADPACSDLPRLFGANAALPQVLHAATVQAGGTRYVHVSSAAVQGRTPVVDESFTFEGFSPYAASKSLGEILLSQCLGTIDTVIYRATSVQGLDRAMTRSLTRYATLPLIPIVGEGNQRLPLSLIDNVGAALAFLATEHLPSGCYIHPWEGVTTESLFLALAPRPKFLRLPAKPVRVALEALYAASRVRRELAAVARRAELLFCGQDVACSSLTKHGFHPPVGVEGYERLQHVAANAR
jgi:nucleoside-diphosphate-sugar epimerase